MASLISGRPQIHRWHEALCLYKMIILRCWHPCVAHPFRQYPERPPYLLVSAIGHHFILFRDISFTIILCYVPCWVHDTLQHGDHCSFQYVWWSSRPSYIWASVVLPKDHPEVTELSIACGVCEADRSALHFCVCSCWRAAVSSTQSVTNVHQNHVILRLVTSFLNNVFF